jgi:hypothetical protein
VPKANKLKKSKQSETSWIADQRRVVEEYLCRQKVDHLGVGECPAFFVHPYIALWAIQSKKAPGGIGWWAISGDLPTDYISSADGRHPREALRAFSRIWGEAASFMLRGEKHPDFSVGSPEQWPELGDLLNRRAKALREYADKDTIWNDE